MRRCTLLFVLGLTVGSAEARTMLRRWTTGDQAAILMQEARKSLDRLR